MKDNGKNMRVINASEIVRERPEVYWGTSNPDAETVSTAILDQLTILDCEEPIDIQEGTWRIVGSKTNWLPSDINRDSVSEHFKNAIGFPEAGGTSLRVEFFLYIFAEDLYVWQSDSATLVKGRTDKQLENFLENNCQDYVAVAYRGNTYLSEGNQ